MKVEGAILSLIESEWLNCDPTKALISSEVSKGCRNKSTELTDLSERPRKVNHTVLRARVNSINRAYLHTSKLSQL